MVTYKYHFEDCFGDTNRTISYESRKIGIETIMSYLIVFMAYLFIIIVYFLYWNKNNKRRFNLTVITISVFIFVFCAFELFNYVIEYRRYITTNMKHSDLVYSYKSLKNENGIIIAYLKVFITYLIVIASYFSYRLFVKKRIV
jgi:cbb3-type cytochrome oxidase subunit 3